MKRVRLNLLVGPAAIALAPLMLSCAGLPLSFFNSEFLTDLGIGGDRSAFVPGEAPAIAISIANDTDRRIEAQLSYRSGSDTVNSSTFSLPSQTSDSEAYLCPITEITLGDISDLDQPGAIVRLGAGSDSDPFISVEPFGALLKEGVNFDCGDVIRFSVQRSANTPSGYQIFAFIQRAN